ncbi:conserved hypothetical protein [Thermosulfidibacter takaii ABI70S6]|uniref:Uncharacterized protein n=1 Tax=Thermosulfidibacter takaii (strain DSM 17441 / JCM 13301 / NBRC 103674 / ABI70S6) TaxID=1298851 RepID=A0A0S3QTI6_THET7|nr:multiheme c-type cytochrome [Thermosulfidibacter takaii]BAT71636.1 conserved hypothetical protein [Thermosulfidibacter takaii ABI70S6]
MRRISVFLALFMLLAWTCQAAEMGKFKYRDFKKPKRCGACHKEIYHEWKESMMAKSFVHEWDDVEYFKLALPHAMKFEKVAGVKAGCIACHAPLAFLTGDIPPKQPKANTRANEGVSCEICHNITGTSEKVPYNFSYTIKPGKTKQAPRKGIKAPHPVEYNPFLKTPEFCATCHDEASPYGAWVKSTYREWKEGPYAKMGIRCQDCHMHYAPGHVTRRKVRENMAHHVFHGAHSPSKLKGAVELAIFSNKNEVKPGDTVKLSVTLFNAKVGHYIPSGSSEERMLWLEVWAIDATGKKWHIPVDKKGFKGEEYTIADPNALAYQAMGEIMGIKDFKGVKRDGDVPKGARIFRRPFFDPKGRMTICQWYTKDNTLVDYRIGPMEAKVETYTFKVPKDAKGPITIEAKMYYSLVPSSVGKFLKLPETEYRPVLVNEARYTINLK